MVSGAALQSRMRVHSGRAAHCTHATLQSHQPSNRLDSRQARRSANRELLQALTQQFRKETIPWLQGLVQPFTQGPPPPLTNTVSPEALADADSKFVTVDGVRLHYKERGPASPGTPAVLLLHGLNGSTFSWRDVMEPLSHVQAGEGGCRVIAFDRPPYGLSQRPLTWEGGDEGSPYTNKGGARLAEGLCRALGISKAVLVGHSAGALTAMEVFKRNPQLVAGLVFVAPALPAKADSQGESFIWKASLGQQLQRLYFRALLQNDQAGLNYVRARIQERSDQVRNGNLGILGEGAEVPQALIDGYLKPMRAHDWDRGSLLSYRAFSFSSDMNYSQVTQPVLFITGERDRQLTEGAKKVKALLDQRAIGGDAHYVELTCGHVPMDEQPQEFLQALKPFLEDVLVRDNTQQSEYVDTDPSDDPPLPLFPASETSAL